MLFWMYGEGDDAFKYFVSGSVRRFLLKRKNETGSRF